MRLLLFVLWVLPTFAQNQIEDEVHAWLKDKKNTSASISFEVQQVNESNEPIVATNNGQAALIPASTTKLFSTSLALETLGPNYRPETKFYVDQLPNENRVLEGNLYVRCLGDPSLGSRFFNSNNQANNDFLKSWCDSIKKMGIAQINGNIIVDGSAFGYNGVPNGWNWSDMGNYYGAGPSAVVISDNTSYFHFRTGTVGSTAQLMYTVPTEEGLIFNSQIVSKSISNDQSLIYGAPYSLNRFGTGALPANRSDYVVKASLPNPESALAKQFYEALNTNYIQVKGHQIVYDYFLQQLPSPNYSEKKLLFVYHGESILSIVNKTNEKSVNLFAEQLLALSALTQNQSAQDLGDNAEWMNDYWKQRLSKFNARITDGSGLSRTNAISASDFCALLKFMHGSKNGTDFKNSLPVAGEHGTLKSYNRGSVAQGRVMAKTGTMNGVKSYAGYVQTKSGKLLCFALIINNSDWSSYEMKVHVERLFSKMAQL